jgi:hypothetical protein
LLGVKGGRHVGCQPHCHLFANCLETLVASTSHKPIVQGSPHYTGLLHQVLKAVTVQRKERQCGSMVRDLYNRPVDMKATFWLLSVILNGFVRVFQ